MLPVEPTEGARKVGRRFTLGPGRGDNGQGKEVAVDSKKGVNLRISSGGEERQLIRLTPRAASGCCLFRTKPEDCAWSPSPCFEDRNISILSSFNRQNASLSILESCILYSTVSLLLIFNSKSTSQV